MPEYSKVPRSYNIDAVLNNVFQDSGTFYRAIVMNQFYSSFKPQAIKAHNWQTIGEVVKHFHTMLYRYYFITPCKWADIYIQVINTVKTFASEENKRILKHLGYMTGDKEDKSLLMTLDESVVASQFQHEMSSIEDLKGVEFKHLDQMRDRLLSIKDNKRYDHYNPDKAPYLRGSESMLSLIHI